MPYEIEDRRPGYVRQQEEDDKALIICECGARVFKRCNELHHVGPCSVKSKKVKS